MESKYITESMKDKIRKAMVMIKECMSEEPPSHIEGLKEYRAYFLQRTEEYLTELFSKYEEIRMQELVKETHPENDGSKSSQPQKTHGDNVVHPTCATSTIEKPEEVGISRCRPEINKKISTTEQQRLIAAEGAKMNDEMLTPNAKQPDLSLCLKNQTLEEEMFTLHAKQPDSDRSLKKPRYDEGMVTPQADQPDTDLSGQL